MKKALPKVVKGSVKSFENSLENKIRSLRVLYGKGMLSKEQYKSIRIV
jgi:competence protein ComGC